MTADLGIKVQRPGTTYPQALNSAQEAEAAGFDSIWLLDHLSPINDSQCLESYSLLSALAAQTENIDLGVLVTSVGYRHPSLLANIIATIDNISNGRVELGLGAGSKKLGKKDYTSYGMKFPEYDKRMKKVAEASNIIQKLWTEKEVDFDGEFYRLQKAKCGTRPVQDPHPPILIGGTSDQAISIGLRKSFEINISTGPAGALQKLPKKVENTKIRIEKMYADCDLEGEKPKYSVQVFINNESFEDISTVKEDLEKLGVSRIIFVTSHNRTNEQMSKLVRM